MFETFAEFRLARFVLAKSRPARPHPVCRPRSGIPANDNLPAAVPARRRRQPLVCRWVVAGDGKRLTCLWQVASPPLPAPRQQDEQRDRPRAGRKIASGFANRTKPGFT
ncbi:hypothetical protein [Bradyrhizobium sp. NP1]|uniref:hypothetical protein n=1 Tax=Bradyrhizobium sp. NP1 TaxID=3049772 RepID=UPI0025A55BB3|nr:hypothetical protein [Bradyrhizobium sp. NP1]WJR78007.1 hypothetical protein QOU61_35805 [Bradyrhizobium sp. NP1]